MQGCIDCQKREIIRRDILIVLHRHIRNCLLQLLFRFQNQTARSRCLRADIGMGKRVQDCTIHMCQEQLDQLLRLRLIDIVHKRLEQLI